MTTTATRPTVRTRPPERVPAPRASTSPRRAAGATTGEAARTARLTVLGLLATLALSLPAVALIDGVGPRSSSLDVVASFLIVAVLQVAVARGLWRVTREHAHPAAHAALLARTGYALLVTVGALVLLWAGPTGADGFREHWANALGVLGLHLLAAGVALWRSGFAGRVGPAALAIVGTTALAAGLLPLDAVTLPMVLAPAATGEVLLAVLLTRTALSPRTARGARQR